MVTSNPLTHTPLTHSEAQDVIDSIFHIPGSNPLDSAPQSKPIFTLPYPGRITQITELSSGGGTFNTCYLLHFPTPPARYSTAATQLVLKIAPPPNIRLLRYESTPTPLLAIEAYLLDHLTTNQPSLPVPRVLAYDDTLTLLDSAFLLTTFLPGVPLSDLRPKLAEQRAREIDFEVGRLLRKVNEVRAGAWEWVGEFVEELLRDAEDMRVLLPYVEIRRAVGLWGEVLDQRVVKGEEIDCLDGDMVDVLDEPPNTHTPKLCILDFSDSSILVDPDTCRITGLLDFERAFWGDPIAQDIFLSGSPGREDVIWGYNSQSTLKNKKMPSASQMRNRRRRCRESL
ncbi:kinase-like domain-containing protein [Terfezia claveryi]|nr:kinase-like domain-containing protein [Terfezia claveryi]